MELWRDIAAGASGIIGAMSLLLFGQANAKIDTKAGKESLDDVKVRVSKNEEHIGKLYSNMNDSIETWRVGHDKLMETIHANHIEVIKALGNKVDKDDCVQEHKQ